MLQIVYHVQQVIIVMKWVLHLLIFQTKNVLKVSYVLQVLTSPIQKMELKANYVTLDIIAQKDLQQ